jgi:HD superfamily phosphohydrolase
MAAFVHDVGHGPYSHLFEDIMRIVNGDTFSHELATRILLEHDPALSSALGDMSSRIPVLLEENSLESEIISSGLDVDKMDYLRRDSYHTGVAYGVFDLERVIHTICSVKESDRTYIAIEEKGKDALESYRLARYSMHTQVYEHHTRLVADDMFSRAVKIALADGALSRDFFDVSRPETFVQKYVQLDDSSIEQMIMTNATGAAKSLIEDVRARRLLKRAYVIPLNKAGVPNPIHREQLISMNKKSVEKKEAKIAAEAHVDPTQVIVHLQSIKIKLYEHFEQSIGKKEKPILIKMKNGEVTSLDEESPISAALAPVRQLYVFAPKAHVKKVKEISEGVFGAKSVY